MISSREGRKFRLRKGLPRYVRYYVRCLVLCFLCMCGKLLEMLRLSVSHTLACCRSAGSAAPLVTYERSAWKLQTSLSFGLIDSFRVFSWFSLDFSSQVLVSVFILPGIFLFFLDVKLQVKNTHTSRHLVVLDPLGLEVGRGIKACAHSSEVAIGHRLAFLGSRCGAVSRGTLTLRRTHIMIQSTTNPIS